MSEFLQISPKITVLPIIHGSGDFAVEVRRVMLSQEFDCLAVPLPASFQENVERAIAFLPGITAVVQRESAAIRPPQDWSPESDFEDDDDDDDDFTVNEASYVPIDPCQGVITALRIAMQERMPRAFIDLETSSFEPLETSLPDPYALKTTRADKFAAAVLPAIARLPAGQPAERVLTMAARLRELEQKHSRILFVCSLMDWPWIKDAYHDNKAATAEDDDVEETEIFGCTSPTLMFLLGEMPFVTGLYERARYELENDENLSIDGIKEMVLAARDAYKADLGKRGRKITPKLLRLYFKYVRNLSLIERRMTPDLYTLVTAAQQMAGDQFAIHLTETAHAYPYTEMMPFGSLEMSVDRARLPDGAVVDMKNRLPGQARLWRTCELQPRPLKPQQQEWEMRWSPFGQCSWPPEDVAIEKFRTHVKDVAASILGNDLARTEKFSASLKDGLDIRETLRNWHTGELYVKVLPPSRGGLDCVIMLFDTPADPRDYPWRITWHAEHHDESTLSLFATPFKENFVGPGIAQSTYGGAMFLFPPRPIVDVWRDRQFDFTDTLEERLVAAGCCHSEYKHVALLSDSPPGAGFRRLASKYGRKLVHVPLSRFSQQTVQQLRMFHVLNGHQVRSYASHFIRKA